MAALGIMFNLLICLSERNTALLVKTKKLVEVFLQNGLLKSLTRSCELSLFLLRQHSKAILKAITALEEMHLLEELD